MNSLILAVVAAVLYIIAYNTYGKFLARKIFKLDPNASVPSETFKDGVDFVPTKRAILFGHHFTSIAGTGPIVGPAIGIIWGWVPAMIWILVGSIFMGAVHDFGSMVVSMRNQGRSIGDIASGIVNKRVRMIFLAIIFLLLWLIVAVFGVVISIVFNMFPSAVVPVWLEIPIAVWLGHRVYKKGGSYKLLSLIAVAIMYVTVVIGAFIPFKMTSVFGISPVGVWVIILLIYSYIASTLPVQTLLQPRDYINSHQLFIAMGLLGLGVIVARPTFVAPSVNLSPAGAPPMWPMIFVIIACGAISGFHSLVSSGTSSKQCDSEESAMSIGYGGMLTEAMLATFVVIACGAGLAIGMADKSGTMFTGIAAYNLQYGNWASTQGLGAQLNAVVTGAANLIDSYGIPHSVTITIMGVFVASFAATTLDTATRLQRYVVSEIAQAVEVPFFTKKHPATIVAVGSALILAFSVGASGTGALILWPLFGATNQLLAGLALLVVTIYLARKKVRTVFTAIPMIFMLIMTGWAMKINLVSYYTKSNWLLLIIGAIIVFLEIWMIVESVIILFSIHRSKQKEALAA